MTRKSEITFGDLVHIEGYETRCFFVDGWTIEHNYTPDEVWTEKWFDVTCAHTGEYHMAEASEVTRVCGAEQADDYLMFHATPPEIKTISEGMSDMFGYEPKKLPTRNPELEKQRAETKRRATVDGLLDKYNDYKALYDAFGDEEYEKELKRIEAELIKVNAKLFI